MNKTNRKNRTGPGTRPQRGRSAVIEGVYSNSHFVHAVTSHVGNVVQVCTQSGAIYEGVFRTFSPQFEIALEVAHRIDTNASAQTPSSQSSTANTTGSSTSSSSTSSSTSTTPASAHDKASSSFNDEQNITAESVFDKLIFKPTDVVYIKAKDVDLDYATKDTFQTDTAISKCNGSGGRYEEKELEPWSSDGGSGALNGELEFNLELDDNANGWDVNDMFLKNETCYGVQSTFDQSLTGYTIQIQKKDTQDFKEAEEQAEKIASEIENQPMYKERADLENGDEEARFAAVERPSSNSPDEIKAGKYVAPGRRKNTQTGKLIRPSQLNNNNNNNNNSSNNSNNATPHASHLSNSSQSSVLPTQQNSKNNNYSSSLGKFDSNKAAHSSNDVSHTPLNLPSQQQSQQQQHHQHQQQPSQQHHQQQQQQVQKNSVQSPPVIVQNQQPPLMHRIHSQPPMQQDRGDRDRGDRMDRGDRNDRDSRDNRADIITRDNLRDNRDSRDPRDRDPRDMRDSRDMRESNRNDDREIRRNDDREIRRNDDREIRRGDDRNRDKTGPPMPQRQMRHYAPPVNQQSSYSESIQMQSQQHNQGPQHQGPQVRLYNENMHVIQAVAPAHLVIQQQVGPPQPQRQRMQREDQISDFRKFKHNMMLGGPKGQPPHQHTPVQQQPPPQQMSVQQQQKQAPPQPVPAPILNQPPASHEPQQPPPQQSQALINQNQASAPQDHQPVEQPPQSYEEPHIEPAHGNARQRSYVSVVQQQQPSQPIQSQNQPQQMMKNDSNVATHSQQQQQQRTQQPPQQVQKNQVPTPPVVNVQAQHQQSIDSNVATHGASLHGATHQPPQQQQQQQQQPPPQQQTTPSQSQQSQQQQTPQQILSNRNERGDQSEYQSPAPTSGQHIVNASISSNSTPPTSSTPNSNTPNNSINDSNASAAAHSAIPINEAAHSLPQAAQSSAVKKFVLNPAAKPFTPRVPVTPTSSRPHTPQTPGTQVGQPPVNNNGAFTPQPPTVHSIVVAQQSQPPQQPTPQPQSIPQQQHVQPVTNHVMAMTYFVPPQQSFPAPQHAQQNRFRKGQLPVASQMNAVQVAAATGAPLHVAAAPMPQFVPYPQAHPHQYQQQYHAPMVRMYPSQDPHQPQQIQYLAPTPPSTTPSPGQPHQQQFHQGPPQAAPQQYQMIPLIPNAPQIVNYAMPPQQFFQQN